VPYLFLSAFPQFLKWVPKPGGWMTTLKTFLGFVLLGSMIWLIWVLGLQKGVHSVALFLSGILLISLGCWIIGLIQSDQTTWQKNLWMALAFICGLALIFISAWAPVQTSGQSFSNNEKGIAWQNFSSELIENSLLKKKAVFIDFTAAWCLTCQVNDRLVFTDKNVQALFSELGIAAIKADWTNQDQAITKALEGYGKNSIPLYVYYAAGSNKPILLPELITPDLVIETLRKAGKNG
jgi:thiol:disulfide interchange protein DsbD